MTCNYILFTHLPTTFWRIFEANARRLIQILYNSKGILIIFNDEGWLSLLNTVGADFNPITLSKEFQKINELEMRIEKLVEKFPNAKDGNFTRIRLITAANLFRIVNNLRGNKPGNEASRLRRFLVSENKRVFYDTAKVVESLVRIRHVGSGLPVIRIDWDALLNKVTLEKCLSESLKDVITYCNNYAKDPLVHSYMLSGSYLKPIHDIDKWKLVDYNVAFATRVFPALIPTDEAIKELNDRVSKKSNSEEIVDCELVDTFKKKDTKKHKAKIKDLDKWGMFDSEVVESFYGTSNSEVWSGVSQIGAHPFESVISGSLLVLSDGAILDLPPFSNFRQNVLWIDDHLKYLLHQSLGHFRRLKLNLGSEGQPLFFTARIKNAYVKKDRTLAGQGNLRPYTFGVYIPTLFWGAIMDSWIQPFTFLKPPVISELDPNRGVFTKFLSQALRCGIFSNEDREALRDSLCKEAIRRAETVRINWGRLKNKTGKSFAALWVGGGREEIRQVLHEDMASQQQDPNWIGWGLLAHGAIRIETFNNLSAPVQEGIQILIEDAITYIDWALEWPSFIRSVRAVRSSSLPIDVSFEPANLTD